MEVSNEGYLRKSMWNFQGLIKKEVEFPGVFFDFGQFSHNFAEFSRMNFVLRVK